MQTNSVNFYSWRFSDVRTYLAAAAFVAGNILLPQLFHLVPNGGIIWLPIYFFTLVGAYKYGWRVGLLTAVMSPLVNAILFEMPAMASLPAIITKSVLLAAAAGIAAERFGKVSLLLLAAVILFYQGVGSLAEWIIEGSLYGALQDFRMGIPGMLLQLVGGYFFINLLIRK